MAFGVADERPAVTPDGRLMIPAKSLEGVEIMSANLLLENATDPVIWRGPVIAGAVKQFWTETLWQDVDYMFVDMPPGTGDVPLTVFQSLPVDGICLLYTSEMGVPAAEKPCDRGGLHCNRPLCKDCKAGKRPFCP